MLRGIPKAARRSDRYRSTTREPVRRTQARQTARTDFLRIGGVFPRCVLFVGGGQHRALRGWDESQSVRESGRLGMARTAPTGAREIFAKASPTVFSPGQCRPPAVRCRLSKVELAERVEHALESVGLAGQGDIYPWQMSGGMQQRVAIARALVVEPKVMLMDEPFAAVDAQTWADLEDLVLTVRNEYKVTVAFVTHDIDEAVYLGDRVLVLAAGPGRMIADIPVALGRPRHQVETKLDPRFAELRSQVYQLVMRPSSQRPTAEAKQ